MNALHGITSSAGRGGGDAVVAAGSGTGRGSAPVPALMLELNGAQPSEKGCRLTFVVTNNLGADSRRPRSRSRCSTRPAWSTG